MRGGQDTGHGARGLNRLLVGCLGGSRRPRGESWATAAAAVAGPNFTERLGYF